MEMTQNNFSAGILSDWMIDRFDLAQYPAGCLEILNGVVRSTGGIERLPGLNLSKLVGTTNFNDKDAVQVPFIFSDSDNMDLLITEQDIHVMDGVGVITVAANVTLPTDAELKDLRYRQVNDVLFFVHPSYPPFKIIRTSKSPLTFEVVKYEFDFHPLQDENVSEQKVSFKITGEYDVATTYAADKVVIDNSLTAKTGDLKSINNTLVVTQNDYVDYYEANKIMYKLLRLRFDGADVLRPGDNIIISNSGIDIDGEYEVLYANGTEIRIDVGAYENRQVGRYYFWEGVKSGTLSGSAGVSTVEKTYYKSLVDNNLGNALTDSDSWLVIDHLEGEQTIVSKDELFESSHVGSIFAITEPIQVTKLKESLNATNVQTNLFYVPGKDFTLTTGGRWGGTLTLEKLIGDTWVVESTYDVYNAEKNLTESISSRDKTVYRCRLSDYEAPSIDPSDCIVTLAMDEAEITIEMEVTGFVSSKEVTVALLSKSSTFEIPTTRWTWGSFSDHYGWPGVVFVHEERLCFAGTDTQRSTIWGSKVNSWYDFELGSLVTDSYSISLNSQNRIKWVISQRDLVVGTEGEEYVLDSGDEIMSATNPPNVREQSRIGSNGLALIVNDSILFVSSDEKSVHEFAFKYEKEGYVAPSMSELAEHLLESGIKKIALQTKPYSILWVVTNDNKLCSLTYNREQNIIAWATHDVGGTDVHDVGVKPIRGAEDEVSFAVALFGRDYPYEWTTLKKEPFKDATHYLTQAVSRTVSDLRALETGVPDYVDLANVKRTGGIALKAYVKNSFMEIPWYVDPYGDEISPVDEDGFNKALALLNSWDEIIFGAVLPNMNIETMPIVIQFQGDSGVGRRKNVGEVIVRVKESGRFSVGVADRKLEDVKLRTYNDELGEATPLKSGTYKTSVQCGHDVDISVKATSHEGQPLNLLSVTSVAERS